MSSALPQLEFTGCVPQKRRYMTFCYTRPYTEPPHVFIYHALRLDFNVCGIYFAFSFTLPALTPPLPHSDGEPRFAPGKRFFRGVIIFSRALRNEH